MTDVYYTPDAVTQNALGQWTDNIKADRTAEDLLFQVMLEQGVELTLPIRKQNIAGCEVFFVADDEDDALVACFEKDGKVTEELCKQLARRTSRRVVFRDAGFKNDSAKINAEQIFTLLSPHTEVKCI